MSLDQMYPGDDEGKFTFDRHDRLRKAMAHAGVGVGEMAQELEVTANTVGNWINGRNWPRKRDLNRFALRTGYPVEWLESGRIGGPKGPNSRSSGYKFGGSSSPRGTVTSMFRSPQPGYDSAAA